MPFFNRIVSLRARTTAFFRFLEPWSGDAVCKALEELALNGEHEVIKMDDSLPSRPEQTILWFVEALHHPCGDIRAAMADWGIGTWTCTCPWQTGPCLCADDYDLALVQWGEFAPIEWLDVAIDMVENPRPYNPELTEHLNDLAVWDWPGERWTEALLIVANRYRRGEAGECCRAILRSFTPGIVLQELQTLSSEGRIEPEQVDELIAFGGLRAPQKMTVRWD